MRQGPSAPSAELRARVLAAAREMQSPTRGQHRRQTIAIVAGAAVATAILFFVLGGPRQGARPPPLVAFTVGLGLVAAAVLTYVSSVPASGSMLGRSRSQLVWATALLAPSLAIVALASVALWPDAAAEAVPPRAHVTCALLTVLHGGFLLAALLVTSAGSDPVHPAHTGAMLGATAGAWTAMMAYLRCPHADALHCIAAHVVPTLLFVLVGVIFGRRFVKLDKFD